MMANGKAVVFETDFEVPPWRKAEISKMPEPGTRIEQFVEIGDPETHLEWICVGTTIVSHDIDRKYCRRHGRAAWSPVSASR